MFLNTLSKVTRILVLTVVLASFGFSAVLSASPPGVPNRQPGIVKRYLPGDALDLLEDPASILVEGITDTEDPESSKWSNPQAPKIDKWIGRPLKQYNPHDTADKVKKPPHGYGSGGDRTRYPYSKPSAYFRYYPNDTPKTHYY